MTFGAARQPIGGRVQWGSPPRLLSGYNGNLYLVDTKANQVWRYKPTEKGYEGAPIATSPKTCRLTWPVCTPSPSMAASGCSTATGACSSSSPANMMRSIEGAAVAAQQPGGGRGLGEGDQIYVADTGNGRISVEFSKKTGQFQRQLRPAQGDILRDMCTTSIRMRPAVSNTN